MRIWVTFRTLDSRSAGFTLLETLMVLVLMGLVGSLVIPRIASIYDSVVLRDELADILHQIEALPLAAYQLSQTFVLGDDGEDAAPVLKLESQWQLNTDDRVSYRPNGFCTGGKIALQHHSGRVWQYQLTAPFCRPEPIDEGD
jgi:prepilin-type N-terminal cleavage/methylation domain-containing protein